MSTFAAKVAGAMPRGGGAQQHHQQTGGAGPHQQRNGGGPAPVRQTVGFSVPGNTDRLGFIGNVLIGYKVEVQVTSGVVYEAVFGSLQNDSNGVSIVLKYAKIVKDPKVVTSNRTALAEKPVPVLTIPAADLVQLFAKDIRLNPEDLSGADRSDVGFETDAAISRGRGGGVRELQRWQPDESDDATLFSLESTSGSTGWDQFAVNRERFGVQTTWNEHFYTTKIKRDECRITEEEAARIAREIETGLTGGPTTNIHMLEERGGELAPDVDEEALYGAVIREPTSGPAPGFHQQPHQQLHHHQQRQQQRSKVPQPSAADRAVAWGRAGSGVAAVAGGLSVAAAAQQQQQQQPQLHHQQQQHAGRSGAAAAAKSSSIPVPAPMPIPGASSSTSSAGGAPAVADGSGSAGSSTPGGSTAPIDIDPRREVNKVRSSLTVGPKKDRSSPYGTPKLGMSRSPVYVSPLVNDPVGFSALDLDPGLPQVKLDPEAQADFLRFKEARMKQRSGQMGAEAALADLKKASSSLKERSPGMVAPAGNGAPAAAAAAAAPASGGEPAAAAPAQAPAAASPAAAAPARAAAAAADGPAAATPAAAAPAAAASAPSVAAPAAAPAAATANGEEVKPKVVSKLNPNAKPFSLNINAKEFVPSFATAKAVAAPAAAPAAAPPAPAAAPSAPPAAPAPAPAPPPPAAVVSSAPLAVSSTQPGATHGPAAVVAATIPALSAAASNAAAAPPAVAAAAAQAAAATALSSGQASYLASTSASHGLTVTYHHSSAAAHGHGVSHNQYNSHAGAGSLHGGHGGHGGGGGPHHDRGFGAGSSGGPMGRDMRDHMTTAVYHRGGESYRGGGAGASGGEGPSGYLSRGGGDSFRSGSGSGDGYHHHHHHHKAGGGPGDHHPLKGPGEAGGGMHKVPPPPPQGPMGTSEGHMTPMMLNGVGPTAMTTHGMVPITQAMAGMQPMGAMQYGLVVAPPGSYMASAVPPGAVAMASATGQPLPMITYAALRPTAGGPTMLSPAGMTMMGAPGMATPYGHVGPYMTAPGTMPPPSPSNRPPSTGFFQPAGSYPMMAAHPGGHMGGQPGGPMGGHHMMQGHAHAHGPMGPHMQDGRGGPGAMGGPKGGGRQGGAHRPPRMDHDRAGPGGPRDMD